MELNLRSCSVAPPNPTYRHRDAGSGPAGGCYNRYDGVCVCPDTGVDPCQRMKDGGCADGAVGGVICVGGIKIPCYWGPAQIQPCPGPGQGQQGCLAARSCIERCVLRHEIEHFDAISCDDCPPGHICRPGIPKEELLAEECGAYAAEIACLDSCFAQKCIPFLGVNDQPTPDFDACLDGIVPVIIGICGFRSECERLGIGDWEICDSYQVQ